MNKESISIKQMQILIFSYSIGFSSLFSTGSGVKQDAWIALILAIVLSIPIMLMYGTIMNLYPGDNIFGVLEKVFGKKFGKVLSMILIIHMFLLGSYILNNSIDFIKLTTLLYTPISVPMLMIGILGVWILKSGIEVLANWTQFFIRNLLIVIILSWILLIPEMNITNLQPILANSFKDILLEAIKLISIPFSELFLFLSFFDYIKTDKDIKNIFVKPLIMGGIVVLIVIIIEIMILGAELYSDFYYPTYSTIRRLQFRGKFQRLEIITSTASSIIQFMEISFCFLGVSKGIESVFNLKSYKDILVPVVLLFVNFSYLIFNSVMEVEEFRNSSPLYPLIIQVAFFSLIFIVALIKKKAL